MLRPHSIDEYEAIVRSSELVLVEFYSASNPLSRYFSRIVEDLAERLGPRAVLVRVDVDESPQIAEHEEVEELPYVKLYYRGRLVWSQEGCFGNYSADILAARKGIRQVFRAMGVPLRI